MDKRPKRQQSRAQARLFSWQEGDGQRRGKLNLKIGAAVCPANWGDIKNAPGDGALGAAALYSAERRTPATVATAITSASTMKAIQAGA